jgi:ribonuclease BN (tRNA processing enzyme)
MKLIFYGTRASIPFSSGQNARYGGNTACVCLSSGEQMLVIDAGSGLTQLGKQLKNELGTGKMPAIHVLLGHLHLDHTIGLTTFVPLWDENGNVHIYTKSRNSLPLRAQVFGAFRPPYWPADMEHSAHAVLHAICEEVPFNISTWVITPFAANHPDQVTAFHITDGEQNLVYLCDHETADNQQNPSILAHCRNADTIIIDAAFTPEDYKHYRGWGHSTWRDALHLACESRCKRMILTHFAQEYTDEALDKTAADIHEAAADTLNKTEIILARDGLELDL